jgi:hypothetical protein
MGKYSRTILKLIKISKKANLISFIRITKWRIIILNYWCSSKKPTKYSNIIKQVKQIKQFWHK